MAKCLFSPTLRMSLFDRQRRGTAIERKAAFVEAVFGQAGQIFASNSCQIRKTENFRSLRIGISGLSIKARSFYLLGVSRKTTMWFSQTLTHQKTAY